jgi:hypothetical protein
MIFLLDFHGIIHRSEDNLELLKHYRDTPQESGVAGGGWEEE